MKFPRILFWFTLATVVASDDENDSSSGQEEDASSSSSSSSYQPMALQTGPDPYGSSFPASVVYEPAHDSILVAGTNFDPDVTSGCFFLNFDVKTLDMRSQQGWNVPNVVETCSNILLHQDRVIATGHAEEGGLLDALTVPGNMAQVMQYGMLLDFQITHGSNGANMTLLGGHLMQQSAVTYPIDVAALGGHNEVYVLAMETQENFRNDNEEQQTMWNDPARFFLYGSSYDMTLTKMTITSSSNLVDDENNNNNSTTTTTDDDDVRETLVNAWKAPHATENGESVHVAGLEQLESGILLVAGTTAGYGDAFGGTHSAAGAENQTADLDGFLSKFNPKTGQLANNAHSPSTVRIQSSSSDDDDNRDDWISGMCHNPRDSSHVYLVGATRGTMDADAAAQPKDNDNVEAFLMKVNTTSLETIWTRQIGTELEEDGEPSQVWGISCAVTPDGKAVYFGGVVQNESVLPLSGTTKSYGGDDIFVAKVIANDEDKGDVEFVRQFGSEYDDSLAVRGGLTTDFQGNAIVVGSTFGSLYRTRTADESGDIADIFVATISRVNGDLVLPVDPPKFEDDQDDIDANDETDENGDGDADDGETDENDDGDTDNGDMNDENDNDDTMTDDEGPTTTNDNTDTVVDATAESNSNEVVREPWVIGVLMGLLAFILSGTLYYFFAVRSRDGRKHSADTNRSSVLGYLNEFDVEDVDLKHSATGGWHCSYTGPLAHGINNKRTRIPTGTTSSSGENPTSTGAELLTAPLTGTSILDDSLFIDDDDSNHGLDGAVGVQRNETGYHGLVEAYNSTWQDRSGRRGFGRKKAAWGRDIV